MSQCIALIGAGPSLDYCTAEILTLHERGAVFLVADSVAAGFQKLYPQIAIVVFTVELRRHNYLQRLSTRGIHPIQVMAYQRAAARNLPRGKNVITMRFKLLGEDSDFPALYSPGTVLGVMLSYAVAASGSIEHPQPLAEIHILGADFAYIDNQVYSRSILPHAPERTRLTTHETWQYEMALKKTGGVVMKHGHAIRTAFELMQARENMRAYLTRVPATVQIIEYSPLGLDTARVAKRVPQHP
ncbi:MAG: hypothetical protein JSR44_16340 [Spirochaetes bacterium]|nr:hypothetical protein [Spirochaetota bacterium]